VVDGGFVWLWLEYSKRQQTGSEVLELGPESRADYAVATMRMQCNCRDLLKEGKLQ
jgi:hypothetical protein